MYYLINKNTWDVFGTCDYEPNMEDLGTRNETAFFISEPFDVEFINIKPEVENDKVIGLSIKPNLKITVSKLKIIADEVDSTLITVYMEDAENKDDIEFYVDSVNIGIVKAANGVAQLEFSAETPGNYLIEIESKTLNELSTLKYQRTNIVVEAI